MKTRFGLVGALVLALLLGLLLAAGPAAAGPECVRTLTLEGGLAGELDPGQYCFDTPALGNLTVFHWRMYTWGTATSRRTGDLPWSECYDWDMVLKDKPGPTYPDDPTDVIPGWHYHWFTGVVCATDDPWTFWPSYWETRTTKLPPKSLWLWKSKGTGVTTPGGVHHITEYWTGCNQYRGKTAVFRWTMADPDFQDARGKIRILK